MVMGMAQNDTKKKIRPSMAKKIGEKKLREMRQDQRLSLIESAGYNVLWARPNSADPQTGQGIGKEAKTQNFSYGGLGLLTAESLKPLEIIQLNLSFSHLGVTIPTIAEVVWAGRRPGNGLYRIGLRYLL